MSRIPVAGRSGYTILELLIALGLLGTLLAVAWSILGTYRTAEERGWKQGERLQKVRLARVWLRNDAMQMCEGLEIGLTDAAAQSQSLAASAPRAIGEFRGDSRGFSIDVLDSIDPLPWLHELMRGAVPLSQASAPLSRTGDALSGGLGEPTALGRDQRTTVSIEYRLVSAGGGEGEEPEYDLRRRRTPQNRWQTTNQSETTSEPVLTAADLYRSDETTVSPDRLSRRDAEDGILRGLAAARFRYSDGAKWQTSWDSRLANRLPAAIEFVFDFPAVNQNRRGASGGVGGGVRGQAQAMSEEEALFGSGQPDWTSGFGGQAELSGEELGGEGESQPYDVRIVVVPVGSRGRGNSPATGSSEVEAVDGVTGGGSGAVNSPLAAPGVVGFGNDRGDGGP